ncbi:hypothetical protein PRIPAC_79166, partial [Pristionchus pacificus]|uniref:Uncharacterized protein n=1 Tax=Pristionchus pacificus TaxID=54126 RepID=A0A8R1UDV4_PRIPA
MSGESAQDIEVSITAPNRSFHATVIASDVQWQDRTGAAEQQQQQPRRPIWSSAFGESTDIDSESFDPMVNSGTSLSQDSFDGFAVEFISSSKESAYTGLGDVQNGFGGTGDGGISAPPSTASAAFVAPTAQTDAVSTSIGFAETDRGSISCEMITPTPVLVGNGHVPSGETTVTSSTVSGPTVTSASGETTVTSSSSTTVSSGPTVTSAGGETFVSTVSSSSTTTVTSGPTVTSSSSEQTTVTSSSSTTVAEATVISSDSAVTTDGQQAPGSTFQMTLVEDGQEEHAVAPETPRDRAMSMHERSMLAHDLHSLASTMDTIKDENEEEMPVGSSSTMAEEKRPEEGYPLDRRVSLTGVPVSATTYIAPSQPTIFEAAESAAAAVAAAADVAPAADESSPYLKKLLDAQEATRQLMALLGESTQMLGLLPTAKKDEEKKEEDRKEEGAASEAVKKDEEKEEEAPVAPAADAAAPAATATDIPVTVWAPETSKDEEKKDDAALAASAAAPTDIPVSHWLQEEKQDAAAAAAAVETASSMTFSSQLSSSSITSAVSSTGAVAGSETDATTATRTSPAAAAAAPATPTTRAAPAAPAADLVVPPSPAGAPPSPAL